MKISEVDPYHTTEQCSRKMPDAVRSIIDQECPPDLHETDDELVDEEDQGEDYTTQFRKMLRSFFQNKDKPHVEKDQPSFTKAQDSNLEGTVTHKPPLSDEKARLLRVRAIDLANKATSPKMMVSLLGSNVPLLLDEGSEVNAMDGDFAKEKNIRLAPSSRSASGAGNQSLDILGETALDLYVKTALRFCITSKGNIFSSKSLNYD